MDHSARLDYNARQRLHRSGLRTSASVLSAFEASPVAAFLRAPDDADHHGRLAPITVEVDLPVELLSYLTRHLRQIAQEPNSGAMLTWLRESLNAEIDRFISAVPPSTDQQEAVDGLSVELRSMKENRSMLWRTPASSREPLVNDDVDFDLGNGTLEFSDIGPLADLRQSTPRPHRGHQARSVQRPASPSLPTPHPIKVKHRSLEHIEQETDILNEFNSRLRKFFIYHKAAQGQNYSAEWKHKLKGLIKAIRETSTNLKHHRTPKRSWFRVSGWFINLPFAYASFHLDSLLCGWPACDDVLDQLEVYSLCTANSPTERVAFQQEKENAWLKLEGALMGVDGELDQRKCKKRAKIRKRNARKRQPRESEESEESDEEDDEESGRDDRYESGEESEM